MARRPHGLSFIAWTIIQCDRRMLVAFENRFDAYKPVVDLNELPHQSFEACFEAVEPGIHGVFTSMPVITANTGSPIVK